jgi:hypothetical protein
VPATTRRRNHDHDGNYNDGENRQHADEDEAQSHARQCRWAGFEKLLAIETGLPAVGRNCDVLCVELTRPVTAVALLRADWRE